MHVYFHILNLTIPAYGLFISSGLIIANIIAFFVLRYLKEDFNDFVILEAYCLLGAFFGAKLLYLMISYKEIEWSKITDIYYFNQLMQAGFVFYGGLISGLLFVFAAGKIHKINSMEYIRNYVFLVPFVHSFGRIGCFFAGCCYGIPYQGIGAVVFPEESYAPSGISLFPVQLVEAGCLMILSCVILFLQMKKSWYYTIETYLIAYAILRFVLEKYRFDDARGYFAGFSTSQWISIFLLVIAFFSVILNMSKHKNVKKTCLK